MATVNKDFRVKNNISLANTADTATAATHYFVETGSDGIIRPKTLANVKAELLGSPTFTGTITTPLTTAGYVTTTAGGVLGSVATIPNAGLTNSSVTVNGTAIALGASGTVTAAAGTLTGTTLNATVTGSSLTSVGTITSGIWNAGAVTSSGTISGVAGSFSSTVTFATPTTSIASIRLPHGVAPSAPTNGDMWTTTAGLYARINGTTVGPFGSGGGASVTVSDTAPGSPTVGNLWFDSTTTKTYIYYDASWVQVGGGAIIATNLIGGNGTTLLGSIPYQSAVDTTTLLSPNTSTTRAFLGMTGTGVNGAAPSWTSSTGTGNVVLATSPTLVTPAIGAATGTSLSLSSTLSAAGISSTTTITATSTISASGLAGSLLSSATPLINGTAAAGTSAIPSRQDHVHPTDTTRAQDSLVVHLAGTETITGAKSFSADTTQSAGNFIMNGGAIRHSGTAGGLLLWGASGADTGASLELYGSTHATLANRAYLDADTIIFRTANALTTRLTFDGTAAFSVPITSTGTISATGLAGSLLTSTVGSTLGTASAGTSAIPARSDHVHPTEFPTQTGNSGKFLQTNGTTVSWASAGAFYQATAPTAATGLIWVDSDTDVLYIYNGTTWHSPLGTEQNAQTGTAYTLVLTDRSKLIEMNNAAANTLTVPLNSSAAFPIGTQITIAQTGAGQTTIAATGGVTINATPGLKLRAQWSTATLIKRGTDTWLAFGDLVA